MVTKTVNDLKNEIKQSTLSITEVNAIMDCLSGIPNEKVLNKHFVKALATSTSTDKDELFYILGIK